jgi:hypothetical protein
MLLVLNLAVADGYVATVAYTTEVHVGEDRANAVSQFPHIDVTCALGAVSVTSLSNDASDSVGLVSITPVVVG